MALAQCRECAGEVSTYASTCPHCGAPSPVARPVVMRQNRTGRRVLRFAGISAIVVVGVLVALITVYVLSADWRESARAANDYSDAINKATGWQR
jgi:hypothetical protein